MTDTKGLNDKVEEFTKEIEKETIKKIAKTAQGKLVVHVNGLIVEIKNLLKSKENAFDRVIEYLDKEEHAKHNLVGEVQESYKHIVVALRNLAKQTQDVKVINYPKPLTPDEIEGAFTNALDVVKNILTRQGEIPEGGYAELNGERKVEKIVENFETYSLTTTISYTNNRISWKTVKKVY